MMVWAFLPPHATPNCKIIYSEIENVVDKVEDGDFENISVQDYIEKFFKQNETDIKQENVDKSQKILEKQVSTKDEDENLFGESRRKTVDKRFNGEVEYK